VELEEVEAIHTAELNTGKIAEGLLDTVVSLVHNERSPAEDVTAVTGLTLTGTDLFGVGRLVHIVQGSNSGEDVLCRGRLLRCLEGINHNERDLWDLINLVASGHNESRDSARRQRTGHGITPLGLIDLTVPPTPRLGGGEHASSATHVTERTLSRPGSTTTADTGNTRHGATSTPGGGRDLLTGPRRDRVGLTVVLVHIRVNELDNVGTHGSGHDSGEGGLTGFFPGEGEDGN